MTINDKKLTAEQILEMALLPQTMNTPNENKMNKTHRLLNIGDAIKTGDEFYSIHDGWKRIEYAGVVSDADNPIRREISATWPEPIATALRLPADADADKVGNVLVWMSTGSWFAAKYVDAKHYSHWLPQPPAPKSAEDVAFEQWINERHDKGLVYTAALAAFRLGIVSRRFPVSSGSQRTTLTIAVQSCSNALLSLVSPSLLSWQSRMIAAFNSIPSKRNVRLTLATSCSRFSPCRRSTRTSCA